MVSPVSVSSPRNGQEDSCRFSLKKVLKYKLKGQPCKNLRDTHSLERSIERNFGGTSDLRVLQTLHSKSKISNVNTKKGHPRGILQPSLKFLNKTKNNNTSHIKTFKSQTRLTNFSSPIWVQDASKLSCKINDKKKFSLLGSPLCQKQIKLPICKQNDDFNLVSKPIKNFAKFVSLNKLTLEENDSKLQKIKAKKQVQSSKSPLLISTSLQANLDHLTAIPTINREKGKRRTSTSGSPQKKRRRKTKKICISKKDKPSEVKGEPQLPNFIIQPPRQLQRHYLLNNINEIRDSFSESSLQTDDHRKTIKIGAVEKLRDLKKATAQDKTRKRIKGSHSKDREIVANERSSENELVAETIQNFYRDWNSNVMDEKNEDPVVEEDERQKSSIAYEQVKISFGAIDTPIQKESSSLSSVYNRDVSLCLSHTKYGNNKSKPIVDNYLLERHKAILAQQKKDTLNKIYQKPEVFRSIYKLVTSAKKIKEINLILPEERNGSSSIDSKHNLNPESITKLPKKVDIKIHDQSREDDPPCAETKTKFPKVPKINLQNWNNFAKEEYNKWAKVTSLLHIIEDKIGSKAAEDVIHLFKQLESFAEHSKKNLKEVFLPPETGMSNTLSDIGTLRQESSFKGNSFFERKMAIRKVIPLEPLPSSGSCNPYQDVENIIDKDGIESPHLSKSGTDYKKQLESMTLEKWVNPLPVLRNSNSAIKLEKHLDSL